jgi:hypothetical protein
MEHHVTAGPFVVSALRAAAADNQRAAIWLPHEPVGASFTEEDQWARSLPVIRRAADSKENPVYLAPHSISVRRAAQECIRLSAVEGVVALTPNSATATDKRSDLAKVMHEGAHWRTFGAAFGNMATTASLATGFTVRLFRHFKLAREISREGLHATDVLRPLVDVSQKKPTGVMLATHDRVFPSDVAREQLVEMGYQGLIQSIPATYVSAFVNHRNGKAFYNLWAEVVKTSNKEREW